MDLDEKVNDLEQEIKLLLERLDACARADEKVNSLM
jgi:hypothetical protein